MLPQDCRGHHPLSVGRRQSFLVLVVAEKLRHSLNPPVRFRQFTSMDIRPGSNKADVRMASPKIVQVLRKFSAAGGVETVAYELQRARQQAGVDATSLCCAGAAHGMNVQTVLPMLGRLPTRGRWRHLGRLLAVPAFTLMIAPALLRAREAGAVVVSHGDTLSGDVLVVHAVNRESLHRKCAEGSYRWLANPLHAWVEARDWWVLGQRRFQRYVAVSRRIEEELVRHHAVPRDRIVVIPNGIDLDRFCSDAGADADLRADLAIPAVARLLLFVGHEFTRKGLSHVIDALPRLGPDFHLLVVGTDDPARFAASAASHGVAGRVYFLGPRGDLPALYRAADAFVFPTGYESFSLVCMEALACGTPIFATRVGGIEDYLVDGEAGFAIERNGDDIAARLQGAFAKPGTYGAPEGRRPRNRLRLCMAGGRGALRRHAGNDHACPCRSSSGAGAKPRRAAGATPGATHRPLVADVPQRRECGGPR
ncbi:glycosyltransferase family 4 protein [Lichenicoccus roseus]|uniref:glycosyltransferase family 4 protein n=1 Tax=Lichenicoccus roseus TaxID=2683649 RepID=UPI001980EF0E|nr:glycosyltransferase family 4 protein [Lichenicoccus roseus]